MNACSICTVLKEAHNDPTIHHEFSEDGHLRPLQPRTKSQLPPGSDAVLRFVLLKKGLVTQEELRESAIALGLFNNPKAKVNIVGPHADGGNIAES